MKLTQVHTQLPHAFRNLDMYSIIQCLLSEILCSLHLHRRGGVFICLLCFSSLFLSRMRPRPATNMRYLSPASVLLSPWFEVQMRICAAEVQLAGHTSSSPLLATATMSTHADNFKDLAAPWMPPKCSSSREAQSQINMSTLRISP